MAKFIETLIKTGYAIAEEPVFETPVAASGNYQATNGFWYQVGKGLTKIHTGRVGYSTEFKAVCDEIERDGVSFSKMSEYEGAILKRLVLQTDG